MLSELWRALFSKCGRSEKRADFFYSLGEQAIDQTIDYVMEQQHEAKHGPLGESDQSSKKVLRIKRIFYALAALILIGAAFRINVSPNSAWKVAMIIFICTFTMYQTYQFLTGGIMISKVGRRLEDNSVSKVERRIYFLLHAALLFACIYFLIVGEPVIF